MYNKPTLDSKLDSQIQWLCFPFSVSCWPGYSIQVMTRANVLTRQLGQRSVHVIGMGIFSLFYPLKNRAQRSAPHALGIACHIGHIYAIAPHHQSLASLSPYTQTHTHTLSPHSLSLSPILASLRHGPLSMQIPSQTARKLLVGWPHVPVPRAVLCPSPPGFVASSISPFSFIISPSVDRRGVDVDPFILWLSLVTLKMLSLAALSNAPLKEAQLLCVIAFRYPLFMIPVPLCLVLLRSWRVLSSWSHPYLCLASRSSPCSISFRPHLYYTFNLVSERFVHDSQALQRALEGHHHRLALSRRHGRHLLSFRFVFPVHSCPRPFTIASALAIACEHSVLGPCSSSLTPAQNPTPHSNSC
ncbi:hypothetical protein EDB86DRAFT_2246371 [Lactarius hatsudake]|nr:hypothetical protein EDB86DRAFT_2246371 [Lactarius hatsudake]